MYAPKYTITNKILGSVGQIEAAKEVIENAPLVPYYEKKFRSEAIAKVVHHGTHIEGNDLSLSQTKKVLEGEAIVAKERDIQEVINYRNVVSLLDELGEKREPYDKALLLDIYRETVKNIVSEEKAEGFRKTQVVIKEEGSGKIVFQPPPFVEVPYLLDDFFEWLNGPDAGSVHPVLKAAIVHYVLVAIHPFVEGNGRSARALATLILLRENYDIKRFFALEEHFDADPASYYEAFAETDKQSRDIAGRDLTSWLEYFTEVVAAELVKVKESIRKLSIDSKLKIKIGDQVALTERQMKLIEYISENGSGVMVELAGVVPMVSEDTILRDLNDLMEKRIIKKQGRTKASRYFIAGSN
jgi:Fic family protein